MAEVRDTPARSGASTIALSRESGGAWLPVGLAAFGFVVTLAGMGILGARLTDPPSIFLAIAGGTLLLGLERLFSVSKALVRTQLAAAIVDEGGGVGGSARELREERLRVLKAIKELDFDYAVGKLEAADYEQIVGAYKLRAIELGRALQSPSASRRPKQDASTSVEEGTTAEASVGASQDASSDAAAPGVSP